MRLQRLEFKELVNQPAQWSVGPVELDSAMLIVGKNAAGKSRTMSVLWSLSSILRGRISVAAGTWHVTFLNEGDSIAYELSCEANLVVRERLVINGKTVLERDKDGTGILDASGSGQPVPLRFKVPPNAIAVVAKRDLLQHAYLEPLHQWATSVRFYPFGTHMGKEELGILMKDAPPADPSDWRRTLGLFARAVKEYPETFVAKVLSYMARLGYQLDDIHVEQVPVLSTETPLPGPLVCLAVKECDLQCWTNQVHMSQGMFRALALMIHLAYAELSGQPGCILLDDVGEGLDYERSTKLIQLLLEIAQKNKVQVLMSTNDRFVMNAVPLAQWAIIRRKGSHCEILTYKNSRSMFDEFTLTGLSNFDLLSSGFFQDAPSVH